jgi:hypothetical protein
MAGRGVALSCEDGGVRICAIQAIAGMSTTAHCAPDQATAWPDDDARFYAEGLARSDYVQRVGGALVGLLGPCGSLLDVGAGDGTLGQRLIQPTSRLTAIEPNAFMARRLAAAMTARPRGEGGVVAASWQDALPKCAVHDVVLAANTSGPWEDAARFLDLCRARASRAVAWVVSAQRGPRRWCLGGFLPAELHGEDERPGVEVVATALGAHRLPEATSLVDWRYRYLFATREEAFAHFRRHLSAPELEPALRRHLDARLVHVDGGWLAEAPKRSALLVWRGLTSETL